MIKRFANGGENKKDTVPALLTPGEFVFNEGAAKKIGLSKLNAMNKQGEVQGFAKGGAVGRVQRFAEGGGVGSNLSSQNNLNTFDIGTAEAEVEAAFKELGLKGQELTDAVGQAAVNMENGASAVQAFAEEQKKFKANQLNSDTSSSFTNVDASGFAGGQGSQDKRLKRTDSARTDDAERKKLAIFQKQLIKSVKKRIHRANANISKEEALARATEVVRKQYGELASSIQGNIDAGEKLAEAEREAATEKELQTNAAGVQERGQSSLKELQGVQGVASSAQQFVFLGAMAGSLATQFTGLSEATKTAITQTLGYVAGMIGGIGTIADLGISITSSILTRKLEAAAISSSKR